MKTDCNKGAVLSGQDILEEIVPLVVDDDEGREVLDRDLVDGLHAQLGVDHDLVFIA